MIPQYCRICDQYYIATLKNNVELYWYMYINKEKIIFYVCEPFIKRYWQSREMILCFRCLLVNSWLYFRPEYKKRNMVKCQQWDRTNYWTPSSEMQVYNELTLQMLSNISWVKISEMLNIDENCFRWQITRCWRSRMLWWRTNWRPSERVYRHDIIETCTSMIIGKVYLFWWDHQECVWMCHFEKCTYMNIEKDTIKVIGVFDACFFFL